MIEIGNFDTYSEYGLQENPFTVQALRPNQRGLRLLIGRDNEINQVARSLHKEGKITCLDGNVGVGKTSLVNVASYLCYDAFLKGNTNQLIIPIDEAFQLKKDDDIDNFCRTVFFKVAQTLIKYKKEIELLSETPKNINQLDAWLNSPVIQHINSSLNGGFRLGVPNTLSISAGMGGQTNNQLNNSSGFSEQGFESLVKDWLNSIFTEQLNGGVVCVIDNLELLESGSKARATLELLRDKLFNVRGLRWVCCGANGVIHSLAASKRLGAFLNMPVIDVNHIDKSALEPLFRARFQEFAIIDEADAWDKMPLGINDLKDLYPIINFNLRDLLSLGDQYCEDISAKRLKLTTVEAKRKRFSKWLEDATTKKYLALSARISNTAWTILDLVMSDDLRGNFGIGDFDSLNQNSLTQISKSTFEKNLRELEKHDLISRQLDDSQENYEQSFKRSVYTVTAKGAMVHYARLVKQENQAVKPLTWLRRVY